MIATNYKHGQILPGATLSYYAGINNNYLCHYDRKEIQIIDYSTGILNSKRSRELFTIPEFSHNLYYEHNNGFVRFYRWDPISSHEVTHVKDVSLVDESYYCPGYNSKYIIFMRLDATEIISICPSTLEIIHNVNLSTWSNSKDLQIIGCDYELNFLCITDTSSLSIVSLCGELIELIKIFLEPYSMSDMYIDDRANIITMITQKNKTSLSVLYANNRNNWIDLISYTKDMNRLVVDNDGSIMIVHPLRFFELLENGDVIYNVFGKLHKLNASF